MRKHTPGPWIVDNGSIYTKAEHLPIAKMERDTSPIPPIERDSNAALIATAPEMLDAMEEVIPILTADLNALGEWEDEVENFLAAINKAKGVT